MSEIRSPLPLRPTAASPGVDPPHQVAGRDSDSSRHKRGGDADEALDRDRFEPSAEGESERSAKAPADPGPERGSSVEPESETGAHVDRRA